MKKIIQAAKAKDYATKQSIRLSEKTLERREKANGFLPEVGNLSSFTGKTFRETFSTKFEFSEFLRQCFEISNKSLTLVAITGAIMGVVLTIQSRPVLVDFGAVFMLPAMITISMIREIGLVITALICAGKIGSGVGAELGSMKVTEQIDAMEVSANNPMRFLVVTRVLAAMLMIPLLVIFADTLGFFGSWLGVNIKGHVSFTLFFSQAFSHLEFIDFIPATIKSFFSGL